MQTNKRHYVIGTAGHIDHGKTSMVKHLTGKDTDWLKEEKARGMTIDLGFAFMGDDITIIDVPGHEKFIRNMVAGVSTIDLVLFVIAADDGVMPQSKEHLEILKLLQIKKGIIVITKIDLMESDWLELVKEDVKDLITGTFLENSPIVSVSSETGAGIEELKMQILQDISKADQRQDRGVFRLPIDRIFTIKGFGTIAAGTVLSGHLKVDDSVRLLPQSRDLRVRGLQIHETDVEKVSIGDRAAVNLAGIEKEIIQRGDVLVEAGYFQSTKYFDAKLYILESAGKPVKHNDRIRMNIGTNELIGRLSILHKQEIKPGESAYVQFRMEKPLVAAMGDRFVIRTYSPIRTVGGGAVLGVNTKRHKRFSEDVISGLEIFETNDNQKITEHLLQENGYRFMTLEKITKTLSVHEIIVNKIIDQLEKQKKCFRYVEKDQQFYLYFGYFEKLKKLVEQELEKFHQNNPTRKGIKRSDLKVNCQVEDNRLFNFMLDTLANEQKILIKNNLVSSADHEISLDADDQNLMKKIDAMLYDQAFMPLNPSQLSEELNVDLPKVKQMISILLEMEKLLKVEENIFIHKKRIDEASKRVKKYFETHDSLTVGEFRKLLNTSRKYALPLLNYFDTVGITIRQEDVRVVNPDF